MSRRLSVILAVYNGMPYLPETVESILGQTFRDFTFIIVDDGSTDGTSDYLKSLSDDRILLIQQANAGLGAARNVGLNHCETELAAMTDADDISHPNRLKIQVEYLDSHPGVVLVGTQIQFLVGSTFQKAFRVPLEHESIEQRFLRGQVGMCQSSLMMRVASARAAGLYPDRAFGEEMEFCLRIFEQGQAANIDENLVSYRIHTSSISIRRSRELIRINHFAARRAICRRAGLPEPSMDVFLRNASWSDRWRWMLEAKALMQVRKGRIDIAEGRKIEGSARLAFAAFCRPFQSARRVVSVILNKLSSKARRENLPV